MNPSVRVRGLTRCSCGWTPASHPPSRCGRRPGTPPRLLRAQQRIALIQPGHNANLLVGGGDPTPDIGATGRISFVVMKGERVRRGAVRFGLESLSYVVVTVVCLQ